MFGGLKTKDKEWKIRIFVVLDERVANKILGSFTVSFSHTVISNIVVKNRKTTAYKKHVKIIIKCGRAVSLFRPLIIN